MTDLRSKVRAILPFVQEPIQYVGGEWNSIVKDHSAVDVTVALAFPDTYAIGMSHLGLQILYSILNARPDVAAERVYAPWTDMEARMRKAGIPLYALESFTPVRDFDILGFSLQHEMCYTNVLNMLDLAGIPLRSAERSEEHPLVIAGGPCAITPEPVADFIDLFLLGDGEERIVDLVAAYKRIKQADP
ncbi:MAG: B12-binding domain-containing radical SAM protein, partial [Planctomycetes bacterium]|nr:B12-binding domain-containing radical SAM protein [Planctomycetota bacterium]